MFMTKTLHCIRLRSAALNGRRPVNVVANTVAASNRSLLKQIPNKFSDSH